MYAYGADAVLKLYLGTASLADLMSLRDVYAGLERQRVPYALPRIRAVAQEAGMLITVIARPGVRAVVKSCERQSEAS